MVLSEYIHKRIAELGVEYVFGVPGYFVMPIWQRFGRHPRVVLGRSESGSAFAADGYARTSGRLGVVLATSGPGMTNCVTGVACAYRDSVPLLVITGQAPAASFGRGAFLESYVLDRAVSPTELFSPITKKSLELVTADNAAFLVDAALELACAGRRGPVHLSIPIDLQQADVPVPPSRKPRHGLPVSGGITDCAGLQVLAQAQRPMLIVGWGALLSRAEQELAMLAERLGALVVCSTKAVSALPADHPLHLGHLGPGQRSDIVDAVKRYRPDVVGVLGASLSAFYAQPILLLLDEATVVRVDIDADQLRLRGQADVVWTGDLKRTLQDWLKALPQTHRPATSAAELVGPFKDRGRRAAARQDLEYGALPSMSGTMARIAHWFNSPGTVVPDAGNHWLDTISLYHSQRAGGLQLNCGIGAMGWAIGAAIGMALARPQERTVCVTGDGSMLMHGAELSVAAELGLNLLTLVFNNRAHGRVRLGQRLDFESAEYIATEIPEMDFASWMRAMGVTTFRVDHAEQLQSVLEKAFLTPGTVGVEIRCHADEVPACLRRWIEDVA